eukprot:4876670-Amphidinium_carterae.2
MSRGFRSTCTGCLDACACVVPFQGQRLATYAIVALCFRILTDAIDRLLVHHQLLKLCEPPEENAWDAWLCQQSTSKLSVRCGRVYIGTHQAGSPTTTGESDDSGGNEVFAAGEMWPFTYV